MEISNVWGLINCNNLRLRFLDTKTSTERLSSGMRINRGADDPSGLAISEGMRAKARGIAVSIHNVEDTINLARLMDASMAEINDMLERVKCLSIRAANDAVLRDDCSDRTKLNNEARSLINEIDRIAYTTFYNTKKLLQGDVVEDIQADPATTQTVVGSGTAYGASWASNSQIVYMDEVGTGATRPGGGGTVDRAFVQTLDPATNLPVGVEAQVTEDPFALVDGGDGYYDVGATGVINDIINIGDPAPNEVDFDGDGWVAAVDNNDGDDSEVINGLSGPQTDYDLTLNITGTVDSKVAGYISWTNTVTQDFTLGATLVNDVTVTVTAGMNYEVQLFDTGGGGWTTVGGGVSGGGPDNYAVGGVDTYNSIRVVLDGPVNQQTGNITINGANAPGPVGIGLGAASASFVDINAVNNNVRTYTIDTSDGDVARYLDRISVSIADGHPYQILYSDTGGPGTAGWTSLISTTGDGLVQTFSYASDILIDINDDSIVYIRVAMCSGEDVGTGILADPTIINRRDRDLDGFPDVIEVAAGSNSNNIGIVPSWSLSGKPDLDGDGFLDHANYDRVYDSPLLNNVDTLFASDNPFGAQWTGTGSLLGNPLDSPGGQYPNPGDWVNPGGIINPVPSILDADGDTLPDPLDPFVGAAEWTTWNDGGAAFKGGDMWFTSNRSTPNQAVSDVYTMSGTTYALGSDSLTDDAGEIVMSNDGSMVAWTEDGNIYYAFPANTCSGAMPVTVGQLTFGAGNNYHNPSWKYDNSQVVFDDGGNIMICDFPSGAVTPDSPIIAGTNPDWSSDGDNIVYESGGIKVYNLVMEKEYDLGIAGTNPMWSPDGSKICYEVGGSVMVTDITITTRPLDVQVGADNVAPHQLDFSFPDARAYKLGVNSVNIQTQSGAEGAMDPLNSAIETVSEYRANVGETERTLLHILDDLNVEYINVTASRSSIQDADFALEVADMARSNILSNSANALMAQGDSIGRGVIDLLGQHGINPGLKTSAELAGV